MLLIEILIIAIIINFLLSLLWNTKSMDLVFGFFAFLFILGASSWFNLPVLHRIMILVGNVLAIGVIVIFQPELRMALSKLSLKGRRSKELSSIDRFIESLAISSYRMAERRNGALIVLENEDSLQEYANKAILLNAIFSSELIETIFSSRTPLHDGAVIIRDQVILAASAILPLVEDSAGIARAMGTRHRAGLGMSQTSDALVIVVSEESGKVSIARDGIMTRGIKIDRFKGIIRSIFNPPDTIASRNKFKLTEWFKA